MPFPTPSLAAKRRTFERQVRDRLDALTPRANSNVSVAATSKGVSIIPRKSRRGRRTGPLQFEPWEDKSWPKGSLVTRIEESDMEDGWVAGSYEAIENVSAGDAPPSIYRDSGTTKWQIVSRSAFKTLRMYEKYQKEVDLGEGETETRTLKRGIELRVNAPFGPSGTLGCSLLIVDDLDQQGANTPVTGFDVPLGALPQGTYIDPKLTRLCDEDNNNIICYVMRSGPV